MVRFAFYTYEIAYAMADRDVERTRTLEITFSDTSYEYFRASFDQSIVDIYEAAATSWSDFLACLSLLGSRASERS